MKLFWGEGGRKNRQSLNLIRRALNVTKFHGTPSQRECTPETTGPASTPGRKRHSCALGVLTAAFSAVPYPSLESGQPIQTALLDFFFLLEKLLPLQLLRMMNIRIWGWGRVFSRVFDGKITKNNKIGKELTCSWWIFFVFFLFVLGRSAARFFFWVLYMKFRLWWGDRFFFSTPASSWHGLKS